MAVVDEADLVDLDLGAVVLLGEHLEGLLDETLGLPDGVGRRGDEDGAHRGTGPDVEVAASLPAAETGPPEEDVSREVVHWCRGRFDVGSRERARERVDTEQEAGVGDGERDVALGLLADDGGGDGHGGSFARLPVSGRRCVA